VTPRAFGIHKPRAARQSTIGPDDHAVVAVDDEYRLIWTDYGLRWVDKDLNFVTMPDEIGREMPAGGGLLGDVLRQVRDRSLMSQRQLAGRLGVSQGAISRLERGRYPSWALFCRALDAMGHEPDLSAHQAEPPAPCEADEMTEDDGLAFETLAIHGGQQADPLTGAVVPPIYQVSTYKQDGVGGTRAGYEYSRSANPTRDALEASVAALEGGVRGLAFASGLAAEDTLLRAACKPGDHVVIPGDAYGGTYRLFAQVLQRWGLEWTPVAQQDLDEVRAAVRDNTKLVWCETPTNPLLNIADIEALAGIARDAGARLVVDNTFASPALQQPLGLGADVVVHSTTKYLGGHSDVIGGALVAGDPELGERLAYHQNAMGSVAGPFDAWLVLRGIKTLAVRMERHCDNAEKVAALLRTHDAVTEVRYPDNDEVARKQMRRFGGMVAFRASGGEQHALDICARTRLFTLAESLGGVESLIEHPGRMTHASASGSPLEVPGDLVRLSVGIESAEDLLADLRRALG
jgi:cystathionine gamma-synthase